MACPHASGLGEHGFPAETRLGCTACSRAGADVRSAEPVCLHIRSPSLQLRWHADDIRVYVHPGPEATVKPSKLQHVSCVHGDGAGRQHACHTCTRSSITILMFTHNNCALVIKQFSSQSPGAKHLQQAYIIGNLYGLPDVRPTASFSNQSEPTNEFPDYSIHMRPA